MSAVPDVTSVRRRQLEKLDREAHDNEGVKELRREKETGWGVAHI